MQRLEEIYTFEDWVNTTFQSAEYLPGEKFGNNSENYLFFGVGKISKEEVHKIYKAQRETYEYIIQCSLKSYELYLEELIETTLNLERLLEDMILDFEGYIQSDEDIRRVINKSRVYNGMKYGGYSIFSDDYLKYKRGIPIEIVLPDWKRNFIIIGGSVINNANDERWKYLIMEFCILWQIKVKESLENLKRTRFISPTFETIQKDEGDATKNTHYDKKVYDLSSIFNPEKNAFEVCKDLMEHLEITIDNKPNIKKGRMGKLAGLISVIRETPDMLKLDRTTDQQILQYFNSYLSTSFSTIAKRNQDYPESVDTSRRYIKLHFKK